MLPEVTPSWAERPEGSTVTGSLGVCSGFPPSTPFHRCRGHLMMLRKGFFINCSH